MSTNPSPFGSGGGGGTAGPWQFQPETYGAKGDGKLIGDVVTNSTTTITSASAAFTSADVGKICIIHGANGAAGSPLLTSIASVTNATTAVLNAAAGASVSNCPMVYGTDDTTAINNCITAAKNFALGTSGSGAGFGKFLMEIIFSAKIYMVGGAPTQSASPQFNAQIPLPYPSLTGTGPKLIVKLTGPGDNGSPQYFNSLLPNVQAGSIVSTQTAPSTISPSFGNQSVIGGPSAGGAFGGGYANTKVTITGLQVVCPQFTNMYAYDLGFVAACSVTRSSSHIFAPTGVNASAVQPYLNNYTAPAFTNSIGSGIRTPTTGNNDDIWLDDFTSEGYECNFRAFDHFTAGRIAAIYSDVVMKFDSSQGVSGTSHEISILQMSAEAYNGGLLVSGGIVQVDIGWDSETATPAYDVNDSAGTIHGVFRFMDPPGARFPIISGPASNLKIICDQLGPGHWASPPAVPASTVAQSNTAMRDATIILHTGVGVTVSVIVIDGTTTGLTMAASSSLLLPLLNANRSVTLTYAGGTPTWDWWLS